MSLLAQSLESLDDTNLRKVYDMIAQYSIDIIETKGNYAVKKG